MRPVFYLLIFDFDISQTSNLVTQFWIKKNDKDYSLQLVFQAVGKEINDYKFRKAYKNIQDNLLDKAKNKYKYNFNNEQKLLLDVVLDLHQGHKIQLIYKLQ